MTSADNNRNSVRFAMMMPWGRVGSNLLLNIVGQSKRFELRNERFTGIKTEYRSQGQAEIARQQKLWFDGFYSRLEAEDRSGGAKFAVASIADLQWFGRRVRERDVRMVYVDRKNLVKTAYSVIKAETYAEYHKEKYGKAAWAVRPGRELRREIDVDVERFTGYLEFCRTNQLLMQELRAVAPGIYLTYEEILADLDGVVRQLLDYLGCEAFDFEVPFVKAARNDLREEIANFDEVLESLDSEADRQMLRS